MITNQQKKMHEWINKVQKEIYENEININDHEKKFEKNENDVIKIKKEIKKIVAKDRNSERDWEKKEIDKNQNIEEELNNLKKKIKKLEENQYQIRSNVNTNKN